MHVNQLSHVFIVTSEIILGEFICLTHPKGTMTGLGVMGQYVSIHGLDSQHNKTFTGCFSRDRLASILPFYEAK